MPVIRTIGSGDNEITEDGYNSAAFEGQWEVLEYLLHVRDPKADSKELFHALWAAVSNSHPYSHQRPTPNFEKCVQLLIAAGAPVRSSAKPEKGRPNYDLIPTAVFTRNPGGNPKVIEMLVAAGADPNPEVGDGKRLVDVVGQSCKTKTCSTPNQEILATLAKLTKVKLDEPK